MATFNTSRRRVFEVCATYAKDYAWEWSEEEGGHFYIPYGFGVESIHIDPRPQGIVVAALISRGVPRGFEGVVAMLEELTTKRLTFHDTEGFIWNETYTYSMFLSRESMDDVFALLQRESAIAHGLLDLFEQQGSIQSCEDLVRLSLTGEVDVCC